MLLKNNYSNLSYYLLHMYIEAGVSVSCSDLGRYTILVHETASIDAQLNVFCKLSLLYHRCC